MLPWGDECRIRTSYYYSDIKQAKQTMQIFSFTGYKRTGNIVNLLHSVTCTIPHHFSLNSVTWTAKKEDGYSMEMILEEQTSFLHIYSPIDSSLLWLRLWCVILCLLLHRWLVQIYYGFAYLKRDIRQQEAGWTSTL